MTLDSKKRILIFSTAYFPFIGGAEVAVKEITSRLPEFEFVMLTARLDPKLSASEKIGNVEVHRVGTGNHWDKFRLIWSGWKVAQSLGHFDLVWAIMASYAGLAALRYKKRNADVPFILNLQEGDSKAHIYKHVWWCWPYFKQIFNKANYIHALSAYLANWAGAMGATCPVDIVPNGVNAGVFTANKQTLPELSTSSDGKIVITTSRLVKKNGVSDLIKAVALLPPDTHLIVAGTGELETDLKNLAKNLNITARVNFLGTIANSELPKYLWASDVFCRPSLSEGLGIAFLEAMAAGVPVVATPVGGIPDFLKDGETGLFCKVGDPKDIADKIKRILDDPALAQKLRDNGAKLVREKYNWDMIAEQMGNIFHNLCNSQKLA